MIETVDDRNLEDILTNSGKFKIRSVIRETDDLSIFKFLKKGNRKINPKHILNLISRFEKYLLAVTLIVNEFYEIIDGQHRFLAIKKINEKRLENGEELISIGFDMRVGYGAKECKELNSKPLNWTNNNIAKAMEELGNVNYRLYNEHKEKYNFPHNVTLGLLTNKKYKSKDDVDFKNGEFVVTELELSKVRSKMLNEIIDTSLIPIGTSDTPNTNYCLGMIGVFNDSLYDHKLMLEKCVEFYSKSRSSLPRWGSVTLCKMEIEYVYNYNVVKSEFVDFFTKAERKKITENKLRKEIFG